MNKVLFGILTLFLFSSTEALAATYYVGKTSCSDSGPASSLSPACTFSVALNKAQPGDTVHIQAGTYLSRLVVNKSGLSNLPITIEGEGKDVTIFDGTGKTHSEEGLMNILGKSYIVVKNLTLKNSSFYCAKVEQGSHHVVVQNVKADTCRHSGFAFTQGSSYVELRDSEVTKAGTCERDNRNCAHEAVTFSNVKYFVITRNFVHDTWREGIDAKDGAQYGEISYNEVARTTQVGLYLNHAKFVRMFKNNVHHTGTDGIMMGLGDLAENAQDTSDNQVYQNTIWNTGGAGLYMWKSNSSGPMQRNKIYNNVFWGNKYEGMMNENLTATQFKDNVFGNNIIAKNGDQGCGLSSATKASNQFRNNLWWSNGDGSSGPGTENVYSDPLVANAAGGSFVLLSGSPAIDKGFYVGLPFTGMNPDIGAFEYGSESGDSSVVPPDSRVQDARLPDSSVIRPDSGTCMCPCACTSTGSVVMPLKAETVTDIPVNTEQEVGCSVGTGKLALGVGIGSLALLAAVLAFMRLRRK